MALAKTLNSRPPLNQRGQGAVEAILALPVFLIFVCLVFQLFFLGMAQMQLHYAAFYAARVGAVNASDMVEMRRTVKRILAGSPGLGSLSDRSFEVEILGTGENDEEVSGASPEPVAKALKVRVHWHYPLIMPLADIILLRKSPFPVPGRPSVHLQASWVMPMTGSIPEDESNAKNSQP
jgi:hypothetical protein